MTRRGSGDLQANLDYPRRTVWRVVRDGGPASEPRCAAPSPILPATAAGSMLGGSVTVFRDTDGEVLAGGAAARRAPLRAGAPYETATWGVVRRLDTIQAR